MPSQITFTGKVGAGQQDTAALFQNVTFFSVDLVNLVLNLTYNNGLVTQVSLSGVTTFTVVIAGTNYTITIS